MIARLLDHFAHLLLREREHLGVRELCLIKLPHREFPE